MTLLFYFYSSPARGLSFRSAVQKDAGGTIGPVMLYRCHEYT